MVLKLPPWYKIVQLMTVMPMMPRYMTISDVEYISDASLTHTPMMANMKLANNIQSDCMSKSW